MIFRHGGWRNNTPMTWWHLVLAIALLVLLSALIHGWRPF